ncbi:MAG: amidase family protein [Pseudomonadota bacterium]
MDRSPGGSSSGSGAVVGAGLVDLALGTQTAGSLIRPAAYCGAVGFKAGQGVLPMDGVTPLSPTHDTVGVIAGSVDLAETAFQVMRAEEVADAVHPPRRAAWVVLDKNMSVETARQKALEAAVERTGTLVGPVGAMEVTFDIETVVADHRTVMCAEAAVAHSHLLDDTTRSLLKPGFRSALQEGRDVCPTSVAAAIQHLTEVRNTFWSQHANTDIIVTLPVPEGPPVLGASTGFQTWLTIWTVLGGPLLCMPWGLDEAGLPLSVMLAAKPGSDAALLRFGKELVQGAPVTPPPVFPAP